MDATPFVLAALCPSNSFPLSVSLLKNRDLAADKYLFYHLFQGAIRKLITQKLYDFYRASQIC